MCLRGGPPYGVPIEDDTFEQYPDEVKQAWVTFDGWWHTVNAAFQVRKSDMPDDASQAMATILEAPIPGFEGKTGRDSCYMVNVLSMMEE